MKTINANTKLTDKEVELLNELFSKGITLYRKVVLFGAGHPQLPNLFATNFNEEASNEFLEDHETTHAKFIPYKSIEDMMKDEYLCRSDLVSEGQELSIIDIVIYE